MIKTRPTIEKMDDIREFCKLFKINIPIYDEFDYYIDLIHRSGMNDLVYEDIEEFNEYCLFVKNNTGYDNVVNYKLDFALPTLVDFIKSSRSYMRAEGFSGAITNNGFQSKDNRKNSYGKTCISLDFVKANFSMVKKFDQEKDFGNDFSLFLHSQGVHTFLARSKSFRQFVFGKTNPKMLAVIQKFYIWKLKNFLNKNDIPKEGVSFNRGTDVFVKEDDFVFVSHDEIIIDMSEFLDDKLGGVDTAYYSDIMEAVSKWSELNSIRVKDTIFVEEKVGESVVRRVFDDQNNIVSETLKGVEGNKLYLELKKHILKEEIDKRDLLFKQNDSIASWVLNDSNKIVRTEIYKKRGFHEYLDDKMPELDLEIKINLVNLAMNYFIGNIKK